MTGSARWALVALAVSACLAAATAAPGSSRQLLQLQLQEDAALQVQPELSPEAAAAAESDDTPLDREKRKILELKLGAGFGVKHFLIDLIFGKINQALDLGTRKVSQLDRLNVAKNRAFGIGVPCGPCSDGRGTAAPPRSTTPDEVPEFPRTRVSLMIPDELFGGSFSLITNISKIAGSLITNAAERKQQLVEAAKPFVAAKLRLDINAPVSTTEPIELLVPRVGPPLGGESSNGAANNSSSSSTSSSSSSSSSPSSSSMEDESANRIERSG
ncbi:uncharacterized protein LOC126473795 [Schistocerca serialis cubense]|uniref:uncharacterized protein LOC126473795 n=1 Tax=Schistocerca serialis cubense TaxID=2023355 RepID=UPI00214F2E48|nr:uncharacterized protein LOC126473795 [Schistocerca serialis cubense]